MSKEAPTFTVCTVSYNRAALLPRVYASLCAQTCRDFEWLIIDSSTDGTDQLVASWISSAPFPIRFIWTPGRGQYAAMNVGVREARGRFFASLDSDDRYVPQTLERFLHHWETIPAEVRDGFVGVCGLDAYESGEIVGTRFPQDVLDSDDIDLRIKHRVTGDKISAMRTDVMRSFPFPEDLGNFVSPAIVWNRIGGKYKTRFVNEVFAVIEYQNDGITTNSRRLCVTHPEGIVVCLQELINSGRRLPLDIAVKTFANYARYSLHQKVPVAEQVRKICSKWFFWLCLPLGVALQARDVAFLRKQDKP